MQTLSWMGTVHAPTWARASERKVPAWEKADQALRAIAKRRAALDAEEAEWLVRARDAQVHKQLGLATFIAYMERVLGYGPKAAQERLRVAEALATLPRMRKAMAHGMSFSAVRELSRVATSDTEAEWLDATDGKCLREIESMVSGRKPGDRPDAPADPALIEHVLHFKISAETHAMVREAMRRVREEAGITGEAPHGLTFTGAQGRWSAEPPVKNQPVFRDAASALVNLGFKATAAKAAIEAARAHVGAEPRLEDVVRAALQRLR